VDTEEERENNGDWLLRRPRLTQGCSAERKEGRKAFCFYSIFGRKNMALPAWP
jgi:hypothetical protein